MIIHKLYMLGFMRFVLINVQIKVYNYLPQVGLGLLTTLLIYLKTQYIRLCQGLNDSSSLSEVEKYHSTSTKHRQVQTWLSTFKHF